MKKIILILATCFLGMMPTLVVSAEKEEINKQISEFFNILKQGKTRDAVAFLTRKGPLEKQLDESMMINLINQIDNSMNLYGRTTGVIAVRTPCIGEALCKAIYLSIQPQYPLKWNFIFYKPGATWILISINFNDEVEELLGK
jgi:hypothetical protein